MQGEPGNRAGQTAQWVERLLHETKDQDVAACVCRIPELLQQNGK